MAEQSPGDASPLERLALQLRELDKRFILMSDVAARRSRLTSEEEDRLGIYVDGADLAHQYERVISRIIETLRDTPHFDDGQGLAALQALRLDLHAIDEGKQPSRLTPVRRDSKPGTVSGMRVFQAHVILCVRLLEELGFSGLAARKSVAKIFTDEGHRGKQGETLSPNTLTRWREDILGTTNGQHAAGRRLILRELSAWRDNPDWPPSIEDGLEFVRRKARHAVISLAAST